MSSVDLTPPELTPPEAARWAARAGLPLTADRHAAVAAVADRLHSVVAVLRELDFGDTPPAAAYRTEYEQEQDQEQDQEREQEQEQERPDATV